jgi:negative regulator of flagellin synthesis FlgM
VTGVQTCALPICSDSSRLSALEAALAEVDVEDLDKVESVRTAIASGQFRVDEEVVAEKLVESSIEQLSHQKP